MGKANKDPNKPPGRVSSYAFFVKECRKETAGKVDFKEFSIECSEKWKQLKDKKKYQDMALKDKKRYDDQMKHYKPPKDAEDSGRGTKRKQKKDPNAPKKSMSGFFFFCGEKRKKVMADNPKFTVGDVAKVLGARWKAFTPAEKVKYEEMAAKDKKRYAVEMEKYSKKKKAAPPPEEEEESESEEEEEDSDEEESD